MSENNDRAAVGGAYSIHGKQTQQTPAERVSNTPPGGVGRLGPLLVELTASSDEAQVLGVLADATQLLAPDATGGVVLHGDDGQTLAAAWQGAERWLIGEPAAPPPKLAAALAEAPAVRLPLAAQGLHLGELRLNAAAGIAAELESFTAASSLALANLALQHRLSCRSVRDPQTGLFNRRYLEDTLARELLRAGRSGSPLGLAVLEVDGYATFADFHGQDNAVRMLQTVSGLLQTSFRGSDCCCRYQDAQLAVLLPEAPLQNTARRAEQLRARVKDVRISHRDEVLPGVTVSVGIAGYPAHTERPGDLLEAALSALFYAQEQGGDRVGVAERLEQW